MNNYMDMNYYMPNDYALAGGIQNTYNQMELLNNQMGLNQIEQNQIVPRQNKSEFKQDPKLAAKLKAQAGDNMNFNKNNYMPNVDPNNLYDVYSGFIRGNMFPDLYNQYKIARPYDVQPMNEQAELLTYIDAYCFAAHDINLYLDTNPNDRDMIELFKKYTEEANSIIAQYEHKYGPLFVDASTTYPWAWNDSPWPWENK